MLSLLEAVYTGLSLNVGEGEHPRLMHKEFLLPTRDWDQPWPGGGTQSQSLHPKAHTVRARRISIPKEPRELTGKRAFPGYFRNPRLGYCNNASSAKTWLPP